MKKNTMMKIASVLLIAVLLTTCVISGTFAKYTSDFNAIQDSARVAKWAFSVDGNPVSPTEKTFAFNLFNTVNEVGTSTDDEQVKNGTDPEVIIAPGTTGTASIVLKNESEVDATYAVNFTANENGVPLKWSVDGATWKDNIDDLDMAAAAIAMIDGTATITMHWMWDYEQTDVVNGDIADTALGTADQLATVTFDATITVVQVN